MERNFEIVPLSDGRKVKIQELTGMDEMIAKRTLGVKSQSDLIMLPEVLLTLSVAEIDEKKVDRPKNIVGIQAFMATIKSRDKVKLEKAYERLNGYKDETTEGEDQATESESME